MKPTPKLLITALDPALQHWYSVSFCCKISLIIQVLEGQLMQKMSSTDTPLQTLHKQLEKSKARVGCSYGAETVFPLGG